MIGRLYDEATAAYAEARREVFDLPAWPAGVLTQPQRRCLDRLEIAEAAVLAYRALNAA